MDTDSKRNTLRHDKSRAFSTPISKSLKKYVSLTYFPFSIHVEDTVILYLKFYNESLGAGVISEPVLQTSSYNIISQNSPVYMSVITAIFDELDFSYIFYFD